MRALFIIGSPCKTGSCSTISNLLAIEFEKRKVETKKIYLTDYNIQFCLGCRTCFKTGVCAQTDDMDKIIDNMISSDIIIISSPSYWGDVTAQLKQFIDRCTPLSNTNVNSKRLLRLKYGVSIAVRAGKSVEEAKKLVNTIEHFYSHLEINPIDSIILTSIETREDLEKRANLNEMLDKIVSHVCVEVMKEKTDI